ncbi:MAG TPA: hypothetical protein VGD91_00745 [Trebonia sp.]
MEQHCLVGCAGDIFFLAAPLCVTRGEPELFGRQLDAVPQAGLRPLQNAA